VPATPDVRLNRFLASAGVASRRAADGLIAAGVVTVNGRPADLGTRVGPGDDVRVDGRSVHVQERGWVLLHKPAGTVTTARDTHGRPTVVDLVEADRRLFPVGRLDLDTTGVLLLTNDGELAHRLMHPRHGVEKTYRADVEGVPGPAALQRLRDGVELDDGRTSPAAVRALAPGVLELTIHEGRNRQVRRMCDAVGHPVRRLHRIRYAGIDLDGLPEGRWRPLRPDEVAVLARAAGGR
jgi:23S rRNA pseudouridine2605 synthase